MTCQVSQMNAWYWIPVCPHVGRRTGITHRRVNRKKKCQERRTRERKRWEGGRVGKRGVGSWGRRVFTDLHGFLLCASTIVKNNS